MDKNIDYLNSIIEKILPLIILGNVINTGMFLKKKKMDNSVNTFLIPSFFLFFGGPLFANIIYKQMEFTPVLISTYLFGVFMFFMVKDFKYIKPAVFIFPCIGKYLMVKSMKNNDVHFHLIVLWLITNTFVSLLICKIICKEEHLLIDEAEIFDLFGTISVVGVSRYYNLDDMGVIFLLTFFYSIVYTQSVFKKRNIKKEDSETTKSSQEETVSSKESVERPETPKAQDEENVPKTPRGRRVRKKVNSDAEEPKTPRRRAAAVSAQEHAEKGKTTGRRTKKATK